MLVPRSSPVAAAYLILCLYTAIVGGDEDICIPRSPEMLPPRTLQIFDPTVIGTGVTVVPICTELTEPKVLATVHSSLREEFRLASIKNEEFHFGYVCEGSVFVAKNISRSLPRGVNDRWTTDPLGDSDPLQPLALGDTCTFFGCYEYTEEYTNSETFTIHSNITVANFNPTSCIIDKDECSDGTAQCEYECINMMTGTANSYQCTCRKGFSLSDDQHNCIDVDECTAEELNNCDQMCTVTGDGWYNCSCEDGFTLDQDNHTCNDIDECATNGTTLCELTGSDCNNTLGSYHCICQEGYEFNELHQLCEDVDECAAEGLNNCDQICTVTGDGWYNCLCEDGFTLDQDGHTCNDIDECTSNGTTFCELTGRECNNTLGSYHCTCQEGYYFNEPGQLCTERDVCTKLAVECGGHSDCVNSPEESQGYRCECQSGYEWNGNSCKLRGLVHVYWVVPVLLVVVILLLLGCVCLLRRKYLLNKLDVQKRYNILFKYQRRKENIDPSYKPVEFSPMRKIFYSFSIMSTLEMYEYPSHDTPHKPHDERDSETSSDTTQLYSTNDQVAISDEQQAKRELSIIMEDNEDSTLGGQEMEDIFPELCIESSETQDWSFAKLSGYVAEAVVEHNRLQHKSLPNSKYDLDVDHAFMEDEKQSHRFCEGIKETASDGYIKHPLMQYPSVNPLHVPASSEGKFQVSPNGYVEECARNDAVTVTGEVVKTDVSACDEYTAKLTTLEPNSFADVLSATSDGSVQTSSHQTQEKEQYPISEPSAYTLFQFGMRETDMHISPLFKFSTHPKTALRDDSISTNSGTASSGDAKSCVLHLLTSSYGTPTSVDPCSCRNTGNRSVTSSGYVSESSLSMYKHGSSANHSRNIMEMSGYVTESLEPVPTLSLSKHSIIHSKVSIEPSLSTGTPDACVNDDQLTGQPSITPDHLHSEGCNADLEYNKGSKMTPSGYVSYPSHDEDATQHPSTPTAAPFTVTYDPSTLTDEASTLRDDPSTLTDDPLTITYDPSDNPSTPTDDTFTLSDDPLTITYDPSTPTDDSLTMTYDSSILTDDPCTLTYVPSTLTDGLLTITYDPSSALADETSTLTNIPSTLTNDPLTTTYDPLSALTDDTSTLTYVPSTLTDDPSTLTDDPSTITDDLALEYALYNIQNNDSTDSSEDGATHNMNVNVLVTGKDFCGSTLHDTASKLNPHLYIREAPYNDSTSHAL